MYFCINCNRRENALDLFIRTVRIHVCMCHQLSFVYKVVAVVREFTQLMISYPKPVVAVVNGPAVGYGAAFLPLCDVVYASDKASFSCPYSSLSQTPEACSSFTFPQVMGAAMVGTSVRKTVVFATSTTTLLLYSRVNMLI